MLSVTVVFVARVMTGAQAEPQCRVLRLLAVISRPRDRSRQLSPPDSSPAAVVLRWGLVMSY
jgi:hypothetical protein